MALMVFKLFCKEGQKHEIAIIIFVLCLCFFSIRLEGLQLVFRLFLPVYIHFFWWQVPVVVPLAISEMTHRSLKCTTILL